MAFGLALAAGGCMTTRTPQTTGAIEAVPQSEQEWRREAEAWAARYRADPRNAAVALRYAQALRHSGQRTQAAAVLEQATIHNPHDKALLGAYGRALAETGNFQRALEVLNRAHTPDQPDWSILSVQGAVLDQMGRHEEAQRYYASALRIRPNEPSVLSNLGLSYALSRQLPRAEETLRMAVAHRPGDPRLRQNLALVLGLQGRFAEAEAMARADLPPEQAAANVAYLRHMLAARAEQSQAQAKPRRPAPRRAERPNEPAARPQLPMTIRGARL